MKPIHFTLWCLLSIILVTCKKDNDNEPMFSTSHKGYFTFEYSRDFPGFSASVKMDVDINKAGDVTFGSGGSKDFDATDIKYDDNGDPALKLQVQGTLAFNSASGRCDIIGKEEYMFVLVDSRISGTMFIWIWDDDKKEWIEPPVGGHEFPFDFQDTYSDGEMQFLIDDAVMDEAAIKVTLPDIEGTWTYGYTLGLVVGLI
jgi:hypothetical protein